jgi:hypothetical protein
VQNPADTKLREPLLQNTHVATAFDAAIHQRRIEKFMGKAFNMLCVRFFVDPEVVLVHGRLHG